MPPAFSHVLQLKEKTFLFKYTKINLKSKRVFQQTLLKMDYQN